MTASAPPLPPFLRTTAAHGELALAWRPLAAARAFVVVALREPESFGAEAFWSGAVDNDLIRIPVAAAAGQAVVFVPAGRAIALALVARDAAGGLLESPELAVAVHQDDAEHAAEKPVLIHDATQHDWVAGRLDGPVAHTAPPARDTPLVFVAGEGTPDLGALARRVADRVTGGPATTPAPAGRARPGCFGTHQRWYLTRLALPGAGGPPRALVRRSTFMDADLVVSWTAGPPDDAHPIPVDADSVIDGLATAEETVFYVLLAGPAPYRALPLMPVLPPFDAVARPLALGPAAERLGAAVSERLAALTDGPVVLSELPPVLTLIRAAVAWLPPDHPVRADAERAVTALETEPRY